MKQIITSLVLLGLALTANSQNPRSALLKGKPSETTTMTYPVQNISVSINAPAEQVYQFTSDPRNFPQWVKFVKSTYQDGDIWIGVTDLGKIRIKWISKNDYGILDHEVTMTTGEVVNNPMRVVSNNQGCEFIFTLFRMPGKTDKEYQDDVNAVTADLQSLRKHFER